MGLFKKNDQENSRPVNPDAVFGLRAAAAAYVLYMEYQAVQAYINGESTIGIWFLILSLILMGGGALFVLIFSFLNWRKEKAAQAEQKRLDEELSEQEETEE